MSEERTKQFIRARRLRQLEDDRNKRRALASFILSSVGMANDLSGMITFNEENEAADFLSSKLEANFAECFGFDLFETIDELNTPKPCEGSK